MGSRSSKSPVVFTVSLLSSLCMKYLLVGEPPKGLSCDLLGDVEDRPSITEDQAVALVHGVEVLHLLVLDVTLGLFDIRSILNQFLQRVSTREAQKLPCRGIGSQRKVHIELEARVGLSLRNTGLLQNLVLRLASSDRGHREHTVPLEPHIPVADHGVNRSTGTGTLDEPCEEDLPVHLASLRRRNRPVRRNRRSVPNRGRSVSRVAILQHTVGSTDLTTLNFGTHARSIRSNQIKRSTTGELIGPLDTRTKLEDFRIEVGSTDRTNRDTRAFCDHAVTDIIFLLVVNDRGDHFRTVDNARLRNQRLNSFEVGLAILPLDNIVNHRGKQRTHTGEGGKRVSRSLKHDALIEVIGGRQIQIGTSRLVAIQTSFKVHTIRSDGKPQIVGHIQADLLGIAHQLLTSRNAHIALSRVQTRQHLTNRLTVLRKGQQIHLNLLLKAFQQRRNQNQLAGRGSGGHRQ